MNRRGFLKSLVMSAGGLLVAKDILKERTYFLPPSGGWDIDHYVFSFYNLPKQGQWHQWHEFDIWEDGPVEVTPTIIRTLLAGVADASHRTGSFNIEMSSAQAGQQFRPRELLGQQMHDVGILLRSETSERIGNSTDSSHRGRDRRE